VSWEAWYTIGVVVLLMISLASNKIGVDTAMVGALTLLMVAGVLEPIEGVASFAHPAVVLIGALGHLTASFVCGSGGEG